jgi:hypothetical protein
MACVILLAGCPKGNAVADRAGPAPVQPAREEAKKADPAAERSPAMPKKSGADPAPLFEGYKPKTTPDTILDYRPGVGKRFQELPEESLENLPKLLKALAEQQKLAGETPGGWVQGNVALGGDEKEYRPSDEELVECEIGDRIRRIVDGAEAGALAAILGKAGIRESDVSFRSFSFRHVDAMGSGRFFYASSVMKGHVDLKE